MVLLPGKAAQEAVLGQALAMTFLLGPPYLPAAYLLEKRAQTLLHDRLSQQSAPTPEERLNNHRPFLALRHYFPQLRLIRQT
ncbi:MAG: hypothetical protein ABL983_05500 [Nitrospira sp.]